MAELNDIDRYARAWADTQIDIWREKIERFGVIRSGALHQSFTERLQLASQGAAYTEISLRFLRYGIYQAEGVGRGYAHDNGGDLEFLDPEYRREHSLDRPRKVGPAWGGYKTSGKPRKRRDWYSKKLYMSLMALREDMPRVAGDMAARVVCDELNMGGMT